MNLLSAPPTAPSLPHRGDEAGGDLDVQAVRAWARSRGYPIDESGAVPPTVLVTYRRLHPC